MRASTYNIPRFLHSYDETLDGGLILPRGTVGAPSPTLPQAGRTRHDDNPPFRKERMMAGHMRWKTCQARRLASR